MKGDPCWRISSPSISVRHSAGAILLFDFRAAFPSMSHPFIWETLAAVGIPERFISAIQALYSKNKHWMRVGTEFLESVEVLSGVRQGCSLSPLLFALCVDLLLRELAKTLEEDEALCAFADDTAMVSNNFVRSLPKLAELFIDFAKISGLELNILKTVLIPL